MENKNNIIQNNSQNDNYNNYNDNEFYEDNIANEGAIKKEKENNEEKEYFQRLQTLNDTLYKYFFKYKNYLYSDIATDKNLKNIKNVYKGFLENNVDIEIIKDIQNNYIETEVIPIMNKMRLEKIKQI